MLCLKSGSKNLLLRDLFESLIFAVNNMNHSAYANPHLKNSNQSQFNNLIGAEDHNSDGNDNTTVHLNCTKDMCKRVTNKELWTPTDNETFDSGTTRHCSFPYSPMNNKQHTTYQLCITLPDGCMIATLSSWTHHNSLLLHNLPILYLILHTDLSYLSYNSLMKMQSGM